jgi:lathosterol oxidase
LTNGPFLGLDWFLLNLILYSLVYVPLERAFAKHPEQGTFRDEWRTDLAYFFFNTLLIQVTSLLTLMPAMVLFDWARYPGLVAWVSSWPLVLQVVGVLLVADFTQYWVHRAFHSVPWLWRFHAIHHSATSMDWLAGSRLHLVDAICTRAATYVPIYTLGFSEPALFAYVVLVVIQATFIHANVRWELRNIGRVLATPRFHHWHHSAERAAVDKNFSVHTPLWDWLFGTYYLPDRWPSAYGLCEGGDVPKGWPRQLVYPFRRRSTSGERNG